MTSDGNPTVGRLSDGRLDPFACVTHSVMPGTTNTLCGEPIVDGWEHVPDEARLQASCRQCNTQAYWLPAAGRLDRDAALARVIEPWPSGVRKHVTGNDDPGRGRMHRPETLQLCLSCGELRGLYKGYDNICRCDGRAWDRDPVPRYGDLTNNVHLCKSCLTTIMGGGTRWSPFHCRECMPAVQLWRRLAGRSLVPIGPHSIMNGVSLHSENGEPITSAQATAFHDQLKALFRTQDSLHELASQRALRAANELGFVGHAVSADEFVEARRRAGATPESGFAELVANFSDIDTSELAEHIWAQAAAAKRRRRDSTTTAKKEP
jgi:hypothetical protein